MLFERRKRYFMYRNRSTENLNGWFYRQATLVVFSLYYDILFTHTCEELAAADTHMNKCS